MKEKLRKFIVKCVYRGIDLKIIKDLQFAFNEDEKAINEALEMYKGY